MLFKVEMGIHKLAYIALGRAFCGQGAEVPNTYAEIHLSPLLHSNFECSNSG